MNDFQNVMRAERERTGNYGLDADEEENSGLSDGDLIDMEYERDQELRLERKVEYNGN